MSDEVLYRSLSSVDKLQTDERRPWVRRDGAVLHVAIRTEPNDTLP